MTHVIRRSNSFIDELTFTSPAMIRRITRQVPNLATMRIFPFCLRPFTRVSGAAYYLGIGFPDKHRPLRLIQGFGLSTIFVWIARPLVALLSGLGMAPTFNVLHVKSSP